MKYPRGYRYPSENDVMQVAVRFPEPFFDVLVEMAKKENKSFNALVVELVQLGKFDLDESYKLEPHEPHEKEAA